MLTSKRFFGFSAPAMGLNARSNRMSCSTSLYFGTFRPSEVSYKSSDLKPPEVG